MLSQIRARLLRWCELSWPVRSEVKAWLNRTQTRDGFSTDSFNNPSLQVATATNSVGESICHVAVEPCYILSSYMKNPQATEVEHRRGLDTIDAALAHQAQKNGVSRMLIVVPDTFPSEPDEKWIRVIERKVPQSVLTGGQLATNISQSQFLN